jgi:hypothetical protein
MVMPPLPLPQLALLLLLPLRLLFLLLAPLSPEQRAASPLARVLAEQFHFH